jgi:hypothetical protein
MVMRSLTKNIHRAAQDMDFIADQFRGAVFTKILEFLEKNAESEY